MFILVVLLGTILITNKTYAVETDSYDETYENYTEKNEEINDKIGKTIGVLKNTIIKVKSTVINAVSVAKTTEPVFYGTVGINLKVGDSLNLNTSTFRIFAKDFYDGDLTQKITRTSNKGLGYFSQSSITRGI